ncbi:hypothetical protein [Oceanisphaera pacifica]|uniref:hypothetical protein n=1 Tax=Oceanisphaera pacifica TaxID=2818389 RepID=UPI001FB173CD|nr:hypothetical protein [Oceanisphaera pacifica]
MAIGVPYALVFGAALYFLLQSQQSVSQTQETRYQSFNSSNMIRMYSLELSNEIRNYAVTSEPQYLKAYKAVLDITLGRAPRAGGRVIRGRGRCDCGHGAIEEKAIALVQAGRAEAAQRLVLGEEYHQGRMTMANSVNTAISKLIGRLEAQLETEYQLNQQLVFLMTGLVILFVLLSLLLGWTLSRLVLQPLGAEPSEMERVASAIAEGDLSLTFHPNATGVYAKLQHMAERLREVIGHIHLSSSSLSAAASSAQSANESADQGRAMVQQTIASIGKLADDVVSTGLVVQSLADSSTQISTVYR